MLTVMALAHQAEWGHGCLDVRQIHQQISRWQQALDFDATTDRISILEFIWLPTRFN
jgi:hypothetical protein